MSTAGRVGVTSPRQALRSHQTLGRVWVAIGVLLVGVMVLAGYALVRTGSAMLTPVLVLLAAAVTLAVAAQRIRHHSRQNLREHVLPDDAHRCQCGGCGGTLRPVGEPGELPDGAPRTPQGADRDGTVGAVGPLGLRGGADRWGGVADRQP